MLFFRSIMRHKCQVLYNDHKSGKRKVEEVDVFTFIGRMVQHILPKSMRNGFGIIGFMPQQFIRRFARS